MSAKKLRSTLEHPITTPKQMHCMSAGERRCEDGSCIARVELCRKFPLCQICVYFVCGASLGIGVV